MTLNQCFEPVNIQNSASQYSVDCRILAVLFQMMQMKIDLITEIRCFSDKVIFRVKRINRILMKCTIVITLNSNTLRAKINWMLESETPISRLLLLQSHPILFVISAFFSHAFNFACKGLPSQYLLHSRKKSLRNISSNFYVATGYARWYEEHPRRTSFSNLQSTRYSDGYWFDLSSIDTIFDLIEVYTVHGSEFYIKN